MTKRKAKLLDRGVEVWNTMTGEIGRMIWVGDMVGERKPTYIEVIHSDGRFSMWTNSKIERV